MQTRTNLLSRQKRLCGTPLNVFQHVCNWEAFFTFLLSLLHQLCLVVQKCPSHLSVTGSEQATALVGFSWISEWSFRIRFQSFLLWRRSDLLHNECVLEKLFSVRLSFSCNISPWCIAFPSISLFTLSAFLNFYTSLPLVLDIKGL